MLEDSFLGKGPSAFKQMLSGLGAKPRSVYNVQWKGNWIELPVYQISIKDLRYNVYNTRVKPHLFQHIAANSLADDYFETIDHASKSTQRMINQFLSKNPDRKAAFKFFKKGNKQEIQQPLVSTPDGKVLNGNQRLCVYRELYNLDMNKFKHLQTAYVAILPDNGTPEDERDLESTFQDSRLNPEMFDWIQQGLWILDEKKTKKISNQKIATRMGKTVAEVEASIDQIKIANEFLIYIGKKDFWHDLRGMELRQAMITLPQKMNALKEKKDREKLKSYCFKVMSEGRENTKGTGKNVHKVILDTAKNLNSLPDLEGGGKKEPSSAVNPLIKPRAKKKTTKSKSKSKVVDLEKIDGKDLVQTIIDTEEIRQRKHEAKTQKAFAIRRMKSSVTSFENILDNWEKVDKKGLKSQVNKAQKLLNKIKDKL